MRIPARSFALDGKVDGAHHPQSQAPSDGDSAKISRGAQSRAGGSEVGVLVEGLSEETDLLWQARLSTQAPGIDGVALINDFEGREPRPGEIRRCALPKRTTTTWWGRCWNLPKGSPPRLAADTD